MKIVDKLPFYNELVLPLHFVKAAFWGTRYGFPGKKLRVIGVTGTNGKTSTCFMLWKMLNNAGHKTGLMTTVGWGVDEVNEQMTHMTTAPSDVLNKRIREIANSGAEFLVLEVTSHAMAQYRTFGIPIEIAVITNVTHEHLDYHKTFERYRDAKRKLFKKAKFGIVNADDPSAKYFESDVDEYITYGIKGGEKRAFNENLTNSGVSYICGDIEKENSSKAVSLKDAKNTYEIKTKIAGEFNVYNSLAAVCV